MADEEETILANARKLPLSERVTHKNWKARSEAFDDIRERCEGAFSNDDPVLIEAGPLLHKAVGDANANAMDKGLDALNAWLGKANESQAARIASEVCGVMAEKCLKARAGTISRCSEACMQFIELEQWGCVSEALVKALGNKVPKAVAAALDILLHAVAEFGPKNLEVRSLMKAIPAMYVHSNAQVRSNVKQIVVELAVSLGVTVVQPILIDKMNDAMKKEVMESIESMPSKSKFPNRCTRKESIARAQANAGAVNDEEMVDAVAMEEEEGAVVGDGDPYDYADPVEIMPTLSKEKIVVGDDEVLFWECFDSKKWNIRKGALDRIKELGDKPRLAAGDYSRLIREIKKIISKDVNINCAASATAVSGILGKGLRRDFYSHAKELCPAIMERFKEKNIVMGKAANETLSIFTEYCISLKDVSDDVAAALSHKNPKVRLETLRFLQQLVERADKTSVMQCKDSLSAAVKLAPDADANVREVAQAVVVQFALKIGSLSGIKPYLNGLDDARKELIEKAVKEAASQPQAAKTTRIAPPIPVTKENSSKFPVPRSKPKVSDRVTGSSTISEQKPKIQAIKPLGTTKADRGKQDDSNAPTNSVTLDEAIEKIKSKYGEELIENLKAAQWQLRLESISSIVDDARAMVSSNAGKDAADLLLCITLLPGWTDKNFQVVNKIFEMCTIVAEESFAFGKVHAMSVIEGATEKIHELKHRAQASNALIAACECVGPRFVVTNVHNRAVSHKNPKVLSESLFWIASAIEAFGFTEVESRGNIMKWMTDDLGSANAPVRNQAMKVLGVCHAQVGEKPFESMYESLKPAQVTALKEVFSSNPVDGSYAPTKMVRIGIASENTGISVSETLEHSQASLDEDEDIVAEDLVERVDISGSLNESLVSRLTSSSWKERNAAVEDVECLLKSAKHITSNVPGEFLTALRARFGDSNRNLAARTLLLVGMLAESVGSSFDKIAHAILLAPALLTLSDTKKQVRDAAVSMLDSWGKTCPKERLLPAVVEAAANPKGSPDGRVAALNWILKNLKPQNERYKELALKAAKTATADKSASVRELGFQISGRFSDGEEKQPKSTVKAKQVTKTPITSKTKVRSDASSAKKMLPGTAGTPSNREQEGPLLSMGQGKALRAKQYRPKPGGFEVPSEEDKINTKVILSSICSGSLHNLMFSSQFKDHVTAAEMLSESSKELSREMMSSLDLIFKWIVIIMCESNTQSSMRVLELLQNILTTMKDEGSQLTDYEAAVLLPTVVEKSGSNQDYLRSSYREVILAVANMYPSYRVVDYLLQGLSTKNSRTKVECCDCIGYLADKFGNVCILNSKCKPVSSLAAMLCERDGALRVAALNALESICAAVGQAQFLKMISKIQGRERDMIEEKIKRSTRAVKGEEEADGDQALVEKEHARATDVENTPNNEALNGMIDVESTGYKRGYTPPNSLAMTPEASTCDARLVDTTLTNSRAPPAAQATPEPSFSIRPISTSNVETPIPMELKQTPGVTERNEVLHARSYDEIEIEERWGKALDLVASAGLMDAINASKQICADIMLVTSQENLPPPPRILAVMASSADRLFLVVSGLLEKIFDDAVQQMEANAASQPSSRGCKFALNALLQGLGIPEVAKSIPQSTLRKTVSLLLCSLVEDPGLLAFEDGATLVRAVNVLIKKLLESVDINYVFAALLQLLRSPPPELAPNVVDKYNDLVVKCLIKLTKSLEHGVQELDIGTLLLCLHDYFMYLGVEEIRKRSAAEDKPLRMVKTVLHQICKLKGYNIYRYTNDIPGRHSHPQPIIFRYIEINLNVFKEMNQLPDADEEDDAPQSRSERQPPSHPNHETIERRDEPSDEVKQKLKDVLSRVVSRDPSIQDQAMRELLTIKRRYPTLLNKYLAGTQERFRNFIKDGLEHLEAKGEVTDVSHHQESHDPSSTNERFSRARTEGGKSPSLRNPTSLASRTKDVSVENLAARMQRLRANSRHP